MTNDTSHHTKGRGNLFLLRHGHTHDGRRFIGRTDEPLSPLGRLQAEAWRQWLSGIPLKRIFSSGLSRAAETAAIVGADRAVKIETHPGLLEIHLGEWEGQGFDEVQAKYPEAFRARGENLAEFRPPGGESFRDLQERVMPAFRELTASFTGNLLFVGHAGVNRVILAELLGIPLRNIFRLAQDFGGMNILSPWNGGYRLRLVNLPVPGNLSRRSW
ncbi:MAG: histidine phosphatase family protein [Desulfobacterales bacterium]